jgi:hypothetical protein
MRQISSPVCMTSTQPSHHQWLETYTSRAQCVLLWHQPATSPPGLETQCLGTLVCFYLIKLLLGSLLPFCLDRAPKSIVLTNALVSKIGRAAAFGRTWLCAIWPQLVIGFCFLPSLCLGFSLFIYALYPQYPFNLHFTSNLELCTWVCEQLDQKAHQLCLISIFFAYFVHLGSVNILIEISHLI